MRVHCSNAVAVEYPYSFSSYAGSFGLSPLSTKAGHFWKFCFRVLEINFGRDSRVSKIAFTEKILHVHTLHDFQLPAYQCQPDRHSTQSQTTLFRPTIQNAVIPSV